MTELDRLVSSIASRFPTHPEPSDSIWDRPPAAKVIDCVLSLNRHYDRVVLPRVDRFCVARPELRSIQDLSRLMDTYESPIEFTRHELSYNDVRRSLTLAGVVRHLLEVLPDFPGASEEERLEKWASWTRPGDYLAVGVPGFGIAGFQYLRMLFGAQTTKPDVHIIGFVSEAVGRKVTNIQALYLLERAARQANLPLRQLDIAIWESRARGGTRGA
jgi:hypothetical protein